MEGDLRAALGDIVGIAGVGSDGVVRASNVAQLREVLAACAAVGASVAPAGAEGTASMVRVSTERLDSVRLDASALLLHAGATAAWSAVREAAGARRLGVAGVGSVRSERVGQSVAIGEIPRRALAGVDFLTRQGELICAGGRTLKDVVGYDLPGLALGSGDRLGLLIAVTLRVEPISARSPTEPGPGPWRGDAGIDLTAALAG